MYSNWDLKFQMTDSKLGEQNRKKNSSTVFTYMLPFLVWILKCGQFNSSEWSSRQFVGVEWLNFRNYGRWFIYFLLLSFLLYDACSALALGRQHAFRVQIKSPKSLTCEFSLLWTNVSVTLKSSFLHGKEMVCTSQQHSCLNREKLNGKSFIGL